MESWKRAGDSGVSQTCLDGVSPSAFCDGENTEGSSGQDCDAYLAESEKHRVMSANLGESKILGACQPNDGKTDKPFLPFGHIAILPEFELSK